MVANQGRRQALIISKLIILVILRMLDAPNILRPVYKLARTVRYFLT